MENLRLFKNENEYNNSELQYPSISYIDENKTIIIEKYVEKIYYTLNVSYVGSPNEKGTYKLFYDDTFKQQFPYMSINGGEMKETEEFYYGYDGEKFNVTFYSETPITSIGNRAFYYCKSLSEITIPNSVTSIGNYAFNACYSLSEITFEDGSQLQSIGEQAFINCTSLTSITIPNSVTSIGNYAFGGCSSLSSITIPNGVTSIGEYTFDSCYSLTSIEIPSSVTSIGNYTFDHCESLSSITFEDGSQLQSIGGSAFGGCYSLSSIEIPNSVTEIGYTAFNTGSGDFSIHFRSFDAPTYYSDCMFGNTGGTITIYAPKGSNGYDDMYQTLLNSKCYLKSLYLRYE